MTKAREIIKRLEQDGWVNVGSTGSHYQFRHPTKPGRVTVPFHGSKDINVNVLKNICRQAGLE